MTYRTFIKPHPPGMREGRGWGNGYVAIPKGHPLWGMRTGSLPPVFNAIHGGVTFSAKSTTHPNEWIFGFDTSHLGDDVEWTRERVQVETSRLLNLLEFYLPTTP